MESISQERLKKLEYLANDFFVSKYSATQMIANNLEDYYSLALILKNNLNKFENIPEVDPTTFAKKTPFENIEIVSNFYKDYGISFDIQSLIQDGTIDFIYKEYEDLLYGRNFYERNVRLIDTCNNALVTDSVTLLHELSHFRNQPIDGRGLTSFLLTETIAYAEEFIFLEYLSSIGYEVESNAIKNKLFNIYYKLATDICAVYKFGILFKNYGNLSKESYLLLYKNCKEYDDEIKLVDNFLKDKNDPVKASEYIMAVALGLYMFNKYHKDNEFIKTIEGLHILVNEKTMLSFFEEIGLNDISKEDLENVDRAVQFEINEFLNKKSSRIF